MALSRSLSFKSIMLQDCYCKLVQIQFSLIEKKGSITLNFYSSKEATADDGNLLMQKQFAITPEFYAQYLSATTDALTAASYELIKQEMLETPDLPPSVNNTSAIVKEKFFKDAKDV